MASGSDSECILCCKITGGETSVLTKKGVTGLQNSSEKRGDGKVNKFELYIGAKVHKTCRRMYTSSTSIHSHSALRTLKSPLKSKLRSKKALGVEGKCIFCNVVIPAEYEKLEKKKRVQYRNPVSKVMTHNFREKILEIAQKRVDKWSAEVFERILVTPDFVASDVMYHQRCHAKFLRWKGHKKKVGRPVDERIMDSMSMINAMIEDNAEECQFSVVDLLKKLPGFRPSAKTVCQKLKEKYGANIIVTRIQSQEPIVCLRRTGHRILYDHWYTEREVDEQAEKLRIVRTAAAIILDEIISTPYDVKTYPSAGQFFDQADALVPETLKCLLEGIICTNKVNPDKYNTKCTAIAHSIIAAGRPRSFKSPILLGTSIYLHRHYSSKEGVNLFSKLGFSASYDEMRHYEISAICESTDRIADLSFSQYVFDNADFNSVTLDGHNTLHVMGGIRILTPSESLLQPPPICRLETLPRSDEICTIGTMPIEAATHVPNSGFQHVIVKNVDQKIFYNSPIGEQLSMYDIAWLCGKCKGIDIGGWNGFMEKVTESTLPCKKSAILFLPFVDLPAHNLDCIKTTLSYALQKSREVEQKTTFVTFDLPLYWKAMDIALSEPSFQDVVPRLGGFHTLMSFLGCIGFLMAESGLKEALSLIYAPLSVEKLLSGHAYARAVRAHTLMHLALTKVIFSEMDASDDNMKEICNLLLRDENSAPSMSTIVNSDALKRVSPLIDNILHKFSNRGPTAKLWVQYYRLTTLVKNFIRAERMSDWLLHLQCIRNMIPYFYAAGHFQYAKGAQLYLQSMTNLSDRMTEEEFSLFTTHGYFSVRRTQKVFSGTWTDMIIEQSLMRSLKVSGGITHGRGTSDSVRAQWLLGSAMSSLLCSKLEEYCNVQSTTAEQHVDWRDSRKLRDNSDVVKLGHWITTEKPFAERDKIVSLSTGMVGGENINCMNAYNVGSVTMCQNENKKFSEIKTKVSEKAKSLAIVRNSIVVRKKKTTLFDPLSLFHRICILQEGPEELRSYFKYELAPYPLSLFDENGMRKSNKAQLYDVFQQEEGRNLDAYSYVIDGGYLLHTVRWSSQKTFSDILTLYSMYIAKKFGEKVTVIFDGYEEACLKDAERHRRYSGVTAPDIIVDVRTPITIKQSIFLANRNNKGKLIELLKTHLISGGVSVHISPNDADSVIVREAVTLSKNGTLTAIVGEDTDLLVLMTALADSDNEVLFVKPPRDTVPQKIYSSRTNEPLRHKALFLHAFTGCDTTSAFYNKGKSTSWTTLCNAPDIQKIVNNFNNPTSTKEKIVQDGLNAVKLLYGTNNDAVSFNTLRFEKFRTMGGRKKVDLRLLPPTEQAAEQHIYRVYAQIQWWQNNSVPPSEWGWSKGDNGFEPVQTKAAPAPSKLLSKLYCGCQKGCGKRCGCRVLGLSCSEACTSCHGHACLNRLFSMTDEESEQDDL